MKRRLLFLFLILSSILYGQNNIYRSGGITQTIGAPTFTPGASGNVVAIDTVTGEWYVNPNRLSGSSWISAGYRLTNISGSVPPAYTPTAHQSHFVVNAANQLYYWNGSAWQTVGGGGGGNGDATRLKFVVVNKSGSTLNKGQVVYVSGAQGNRVAVKKALATSDTTSANTLGVMDETVLNNNEGYCVAEGLISGLNTSAFTEGAALYLSQTTAGAITQTKPVAPYHMVLIGYCVKSNNGSGEISVHIDNGYELDELHNVNISTPVNGQVLTYDATNLYWKNATVADQSSTNEIQAIDTFLLSGQTLSASLSSDGQAAKTVTIPVVNVTSGTGVSVSSASGNYTVTNSAPDQTVSITNGGGIAPSGTYPNFTLTATDQSTTNEIQRLDTFSLSGQTLRASLLNDAVAASTVTLPIIDVVAGTNVTVSKANGIATVSATGGGGGGISSLNGLTDATQTFATGTTGTDFNISSATGAHTFNLPTASATNRGLLSSANWSTFNNKIGGTGTAGGVSYFSAASNVTSGTLTWDNTNRRLGVGGTATTASINLEPTSASNPSIYLQNAATTIPNFSGVGFVPQVTTNTVGTISSDGSGGSLLFSGFNSTSTSTPPLIFQGYQAGTSPTSAAIAFVGFKHNGTTGRAVLNGNETIASFSPGYATGYLISFRANGNINVGSDFVPGARMEIRGAGTTTGYGLLIRDSGSSNVAMAVQDNLKVGIRTSSIDSGAALEVDGTTGGILFPRLTTTERDALTGVNGLMIYNTTTNKFQGYAGGAWVDLH